MKFFPNKRASLALVLVLVICCLVPVEASYAQSGQRCFNETNRCISGVIRQYWERNGGLAVFGFPISDLAQSEVEGVSLQVQWFERDRLEIQANNRVTAGRLGARLLELQGTPWQPGPNDPAGNGCIAFTARFQPGSFGAVGCRGFAAPR